MQTTNKTSDPLVELAKLPEKLKARMFRNSYLYHSENTGKWNCSIEFGFGQKVFGTSKSLPKAILEATKQIDELLKE